MKVLKIISALLVAVVILIVIMARQQAITMVTNAPENRVFPDETPSSLGLEFDEAQVTTSDGLVLNGWFIASQNQALIIMQHGYKFHRGGFIDEIGMFTNAGYGVLVTSVRAHENNPGELITFGVEEMKDLDAWVAFALQIPGIDPDKIGMLGDSMGGSMVIQYASMHDTIKAVVAHSAFSSLQDTIATSVKHYTGLPPFPFAPLIQFWAERELGINTAAVDAKQWIGNISPRPILIINSLDDEVISPGSGELLFQAAREPKQLWQEHNVEHADFDQQYPQEYEEIVVGFFSRYFLGDVVPNNQSEN